MGTKNITFKSDILKREMRIAVYTPDNIGDTRLPVLYFLHGRSGNEQLLTALGMDKLADKLIADKSIAPMIIVCPDLGNSRGINSAQHYTETEGKYGIVHKGRFEDYLLYEVIPYIDKNFCTIQGRTGRYIGGVSAGGYTALHQGLRHSDMFSRIGGHMPAVDLSFADEDECYFADETMWYKYDPVSIAKNTKIADGTAVCLDDGDEDEGQFYKACQKLYDILRQKGIPTENHVFQGHHNGEYILSNLDKYLKFYSKRH